VGDQGRKELHGREELVVDPEPRVHAGALVMDHAVFVSIVEPAERDRNAFHVREEPFESCAVVGLELALAPYGETRVLPRPHGLHGVGQDLPATDHHL
jgi:hypothetical protein